MTKDICQATNTGELSGLLPKKEVSSNSSHPEALSARHSGIHMERAVSGLPAQVKRAPTCTECSNLNIIVCVSWCFAPALRPPMCA